MGVKRKRVTADDLLKLQENRVGNRDAKLTLSDESDFVSEQEQQSDEESGSSESEADSGPSSDDDDDSRPLNITPGLSRISGMLSKPTQTSPRRKEATTFESLGITSTLISALKAMSIKLPTEIQVACIPPLLSGKDCIGNAETGSGKTIAFALPILQALSRDPYGIYALVLTPTRELAFQISDQFSVLGLPLNVRTATIVGGMDVVAQAIELKERPHVVVATPGRLVDLLKSCPGEIDLSRVKFLVLDEADRLLSETFVPELKHIFSAVPKERQTALFTATLTEAVEKLANAQPRPGKERPFIHRMIKRVETVSTLQQFYILAPSHMRELYLHWLLTHPPDSILHLRRKPQQPPSKHLSKSKSKQKTKPKNSAFQDDDDLQQPPPTIIFVPTARLASYVTLLLQNLSIRATALHSRLTQRARLQSLGLFRSSTIPVLVTTDVGARGLDIEDVALVVNWDVPLEPETYTHRVGRTARKGKLGVSVTFVGKEDDAERVQKVEERIRTTLEEMELPEEKMLDNLNKVSTAKRVANIELHDSEFGKREEIHRIKKRKREKYLQGEKGTDAGNEQRMEVL